MKKLLAAAFAALACALPFAHAQEFPSKPVRLIVPFPPGGPLDVAGRLIGKELSDRWNQPVVVDNRAGGTTGMDALQRAAPDGYTLMIISSTPLVTLPHMQKVAYDPVKDFVGISQTASLTYAMMANTASGITSVQQLIDAARKSPGKLNFGAGIGSGQQLYAELFKLAAGGLEMTFIPYKGAAPTMQGLLANEVQVAMDVVSSAIPLAKSGKVRALFVTGGKQLEQLPGVPTFDSLYPGLGISSWHGIFAPTGMPKPLQEKLAGDIKQALAAPAVAKRFAELGFDPATASGDAFNRIVKNDYERWGEVIRKNNLKAE
jgi:tripartite-type tricarboxylate transporter receptor subunit TctC